MDETSHIQSDREVISRTALPLRIRETLADIHRALIISIDKTQYII